MFFSLFCASCFIALFGVLFHHMYIVLFVYNFTDHSHRVETQLPLISCHIINLQGLYDQEYMLDLT